MFFGRACLTTCGAHSDCASNEYCSTGRDVAAPRITGQCYVGGCRNSSECGLDNICFQGRCQPRPPAYQFDRGTRDTSLTPDSRARDGSTPPLLDGGTGAQ
jgi:hypothetical protein